MGLRFFDLLLRLATWVLALISVILVALLGLTLTGRGTIRLDAEAAGPYAVRFHTQPGPLPGTFAEFEPTLEVRDNGAIGAFVNVPGVPEGRSIGVAPKVDLQVTVLKDDTDSRAVLVVAATLLLALTWLGIVNLRRVVRTARDGEPFDPRNARRLQWLAIVVVAAVVVARASAVIINHTIEADVPVHISMPGPTLLTVLVVVLALLALA